MQLVLKLNTVHSICSSPYQLGPDQGKPREAPAGGHLPPCREHLNHVLGPTHGVTPCQLLQEEKPVSAEDKEGRKDLCKTHCITPLQGCAHHLKLSKLLSTMAVSSRCQAHDTCNPSPCHTHTLRGTPKVPRYGHTSQHNLTWHLTQSMPAGKEGVETQRSRQSPQLLDRQSSKL